MATNRKIKVGDLFSGAGLFSAAFGAEGAVAKFAVELDPLAATSYAENVGRHVTVSSAERMFDAPRVDVIIAGPPCQGFSTLGRRDPKDVRNRLCLAIPQWVEQCSAEVVVVENVPPFLESGHWRKLRSALMKLGFEVTSWCLDAADYGVPQRRRRSFTIASKRGLPPPPKTSERQACAKEAFAKIPRADAMHVWPVSSELAAARMRHVPRLGDRRDIVAAAPDICPPSWSKIGCQATDVWGRINPDAPTNTLRCDFQNPSKGRYLHPVEDRVISLREGARLQQIPDHWVLAGHRTAVTRQIGNGVPLGLGRAVAKQILTLF